MCHSYFRRYGCGCERRYDTSKCPEYDRACSGPTGAPETRTLDRYAAEPCPECLASKPDNPDPNKPAAADQEKTDKEAEKQRKLAGKEARLAAEKKKKEEEARERALREEKEKEMKRLENNRKWYKRSREKKKEAEWQAEGEEAERERETEFEKGERKKEQQKGYRVRWRSKMTGEEYSRVRKEYRRRYLAKKRKEAEERHGEPEAKEEKGEPSTKKQKK